MEAFRFSRCSLSSRALLQLSSIVRLKTRHVPSASASQPMCQYSSFASELPSRTTATPSLQGEAPRQFLTSDREVIVCVHPSLPVDISNTKPLRPYKPLMALRRTRLEEEEVKYVQKLRSEDSDLWSVATLARLFNVKRIAISKASPADVDRKEELEKEGRLLSRMKPYRRKLYLLERQAKRQKRLQQVLTESNYQFPNTKL